MSASNAPSPPPPLAECDLDVVIVVDKTGSMTPYIKGLADNMFRLAVASEIVPGLRVRVFAFGDYDTPRSVVSSSPWTRSDDGQDNMREVIDFVNCLQAGGGGDMPEAVKTALAYVYHDVFCGIPDPFPVIPAPNAKLPEPRRNMRPTLVVLMTDAPPHMPPGTDCYTTTENAFLRTRASFPTEWDAIAVLMRSVPNAFFYTITERRPDHTFLGIPVELYAQLGPVTTISGRNLQGPRQANESVSRSVARVLSDLVFGTALGVPPENPSQESASAWLPASFTASCKMELAVRSKVSIPELERTIVGWLASYCPDTDAARRVQRVGEALVALVTPEHVDFLMTNRLFGMAYRVFARWAAHLPALAAFQRAASALPVALDEDRRAEYLDWLEMSLDSQHEIAADLDEWRSSRPGPDARVFVFGPERTTQCWAPTKLPMTRRELMRVLKGVASPAGDPDRAAGRLFEALGRVRAVPASQVCGSQEFCPAYLDAPEKTMRLLANLIVPGTFLRGLPVGFMALFVCASNTDPLLKSVAREFLRRPETLQLFRGTLQQEQHGAFGPDAAQGWVPELYTPFSVQLLGASMTAFADQESLVGHVLAFRATSQLARALDVPLELNVASPLGGDTPKQVPYFTAKCRGCNTPNVPVALVWGSTCAVCLYGLSTDSLAPGRAFVCACTACHAHYPVINNNDLKVLRAPRCHNCREVERAHVAETSAQPGGQVHKFKCCSCMCEYYMPAWFMAAHFDCTAFVCAVCETSSGGPPYFTVATTLRKLLVDPEHGFRNAQCLLPLFGVGRLLDDAKANLVREAVQRFCGGTLGKRGLVKALQDLKVIEWPVPLTDIPVFEDVCGILPSGPNVRAIPWSTVDRASVVGLAVSRLGPVLDAAKVAVDLWEEINKPPAERSCAVCFREGVHGPLCGNDRCSAVGCDHCKAAWYLAQTPGLRVDMGRATCPFCRRVPQWSALAPILQANMKRGGNVAALYTFETGFFGVVTGQKKRYPTTANPTQDPRVAICIHCGDLMPIGVLREDTPSREPEHSDSDQELDSEQELDRDQELDRESTDAVVPPREGSRYLCEGCWETLTPYEVRVSGMLNPRS